jgi:putative oxidoreductase
MKVVVTIARILMGAIFVFFGGNLVALTFGHPYLHQPMPSGAAGQFLGGLYAARFLILIGLIQFIGGLLMLIGRYVTLGLVLLGPMLVCIDFFHASVAQEGLPVAGFVTLCWFLVAYAHKHHLAGIFAAKA